MKAIVRWPPHSLFTRVFALYSLSLLLFVLIGLGLFYRYQFSDTVDGARDSIAVLADVLVPTVADSVVIGDYDTVKRTLERVAADSRLSAAEFIDVSDVRVRVAGGTDRTATPPDWVVDRVAPLLPPVSQPIVVGGRQYGVLWLHFAPQSIAGEIWNVTLVALIVVLVCLFEGLALIWLPLRRIVGDLALTARFAGQLGSHRGSQLEIDSPVRETREIANALNRVSRELSQQHQALADSEARKSAILEAALDCFITINDRSEIVDFNAAAERTFGYRADEVRGRRLAEVIIPCELRTAHDQGMDRYLSSGIGPILRRRVETTGVRRNGERVPIEIAVVPFRAESREYFAGFMRDITQRRFLEGEQQRINGLLRESLRELEYQKFALDQHSIVSITDSGGTITYANEKFSEISGYRQDELLGSNHRMLRSGVHDAEFYERMWLTISSGRVWHGEIANRRKGGDIYWVAATIVPWIDDAGLPYKYVSIRTDITAQKHVEHALAEASRRELQTGSEIQRSLLLGDLPEGIRGARIATYTESSLGIDGDFFAITAFRPDCFELLVGDVMGKGVPAALIGAAVKSSYNRVLAQLLAQGDHELPAPAGIINSLHRSLTPRLIELDTFVTLALYRFDTSAATLCLVNAGHTPGLLWHAANGRQVEWVTGENLPIGVVPDEIYRQTTLPMHPGDALLVYSDGITETVNGRREEFGDCRLAEVLHRAYGASLPPSSVLQAIRQQVRDFAGNDVLADDRTALLVEMTAVASGQADAPGENGAAEVLILPWRLDRLAPLRREIAASAASLLSTEETEALVLASFEAVTNVLRHARPYFSDATIACRTSRHDDRLAVELIYPGPAFSPPDETTADFSGHSEGGFGLYIIENSVDSVEYASLLPGISSIRLVKCARRHAETGSGR